MNNLSWLIYWADAAPSLASFFYVGGFILFVLCLYGVLDYFCTVLCYEKAKKYEESDRHLSHGEMSEARLHPKLRVFLFLAPVFFIMWGTSFLVPSKDTFYLIAASEVGEQTIRTPEFDKVRNVLNKWLDDQLVPAKQVDNNTDEAG